MTYYYRVGDIALIGLAVMGQNLILNMADHGFTVVAYNRTVEKVHSFINNAAKGKTIVAGESLEDMVSKLKLPRRVMLLVKGTIFYKYHKLFIICDYKYIYMFVLAGQAVDDFITQLTPLLSAGDIIIDGGNSEYIDTQRRCKLLESIGIRFVGAGVSGGEDGARYGPSLMPGGNKDAWPYIKPIFQSICAKADNQPCCDWVGNDGAGHFVKMVHNGIEYGDMQLICEIYHLMLSLGMSQTEMADVFEEWNKGELDSFLIEITKDILRFKDDKGM